jgi:quercetin dioxygenase-like cupin family protein
MDVVRLDELELLEAWSASDPSARMKVNFPIYAATGAQASSVVYMVLEPGGMVGTHTDSAEEIVLVLEGTIEGWIEDERGTLEQGSMVLIPVMKPHGLRNVGTTTARAIGFFAGATVVSTFAEPVMPFNETVLGTPPVDAAPSVSR